MSMFIVFSLHIIAALMHLELVNRFYKQSELTNFSRLFTLLMALSGILHLLYASYYGLSIWSLPSKYVVMAGYSLLAFVPALLAAMFFSELRIKSSTNHAALSSLQRLFSKPKWLLSFTTILSALTLLPSIYQELTQGHVIYTFGNLYALAYLLVFVILWIVLLLCGMKPEPSSSSTDKPFGYFIVISFCIVFSLLSIVLDFGHSWSIIPIFSTVGLSLIFCWRRFRTQFLDTVLNQIFTALFAVFALNGQFSINQHLTFIVLSTEQILLINLAYIGAIALLYIVLKRKVQSVWLPSNAQMQSIHKKLPSELAQQTDSELAISKTEQLLTSVFGVRVVVNKKLNKPSSKITLHGQPKIAAEIEYKWGWLPWFSESTEWLKTALLYLQNHLVTIEKLTQQHKYQLTNQKLSELAAKAEVTALHAQIQPHFLFNVLNTLHEQVSEAPIQAERTIESLADMIRTTLTMSEKEWVTLDDEMTLVKSYLSIQKQRYEERLNFVIEDDGTSSSVEIPPFIIQPLVENTIKHAVDQQFTPVKLKVTIYKSENLLNIRVEDNGPGFDHQSESGLSLATRNIKDRLRLMYREQAEFKMESGINGGFVNCMRLPALVNKAE